MTKENNQLHLDLIRAADLRDERDRKAQLAFRKYQNEISDLKFLNKQLVAKVDEEQRKADAERFRLENIMNLVGATVGKEIEGTLRFPSTHPSIVACLPAAFHHYLGKFNKLKISAKLEDQVQRIDVETGLGKRASERIFIISMTFHDNHCLDTRYHDDHCLDTRYHDDHCRDTLCS